jgi:hypothetical protein
MNMKLKKGVFAIALLSSFAAASVPFASTAMAINCVKIEDSVHCEEPHQPYPEWKVLLGRAWNRFRDLIDDPRERHEREEQQREERCNAGACGGGTRG